MSLNPPTIIFEEKKLGKGLFHSTVFIQILSCVKLWEIKGEGFPGRQIINTEKC